MPRALIVSPHLDDAAFSCAEPMHRLRRAGWQIDLATVFTASIDGPTGFALACQTDKGIDADVDYMALRRAEDREFGQRLDLQCHHLDLAEAPHRGYDSAAELFGTLHERDPAFGQCERSLVRLLESLRPDVCIGPLGVGRHVDHRVVVTALARAVPRTATRLHYADQPYSLKHPDQVDPLVHALDGATPLRFTSDAVTRSEVIEAIAAYTTQLDFQFGGEAGMRETLRACLSGGTRFWHRGARFGPLESHLAQAPVADRSPTDKTR